MPATWLAFRLRSVTLSVYALSRTITAVCLTFCHAGYVLPAETPVRPAFRTPSVTPVTPSVTVSVRITVSSVPSFFLLTAVLYKKKKGPRGLEMARS